MTLSQTVVGDWRLCDDAFVASFRLPQEEDRIDLLAAAHPLPDEQRLRFDAASHVYSYDGRPEPRSDTTLVKRYAADFDAPRAAELMMASPRWPEKSAAYEPPATVDSVVALWTRNGEVQRARGQLLHFQADQLAQGREIDDPWSPELHQAHSILEALAASGLRPFRTEVCVYHAGLDVAGQPDLLLTDGVALCVFDWKRIRALHESCRFRTLRPPLEHLADSNYWRYALQVNVYAFMLSQYGFEVGPSFLGVVHPDLPCGRIVQVPDLREEVELIVEHER